MTLTLIAALTAAAVSVALLIRRWHRRSDARTLDRGRAMSGDADMLAPDVGETLAIAIGAPPAVVWDVLLGFGWPARRGRWYEWLGRAFGYLLPRRSAIQAGGTPPVLHVGGRSEIAVRTFEPPRLLVLGGDRAGWQWSWQFELSIAGEGRTRLILRDRAQVPPTVVAHAWLAIRRVVAFVLARKMLLDIRSGAEHLAAEARATVRPFERNVRAS